MGLEITEIRVKLTGDPRNKLRAFCSVTFGHAFVVRDLKIIEGSMGPFIAMPSRKLTDRCVRCTHKNNLRACFCNQCGSRLDPERADRDVRGRARLHADLAHPIHSECRIALHRAIVAAYLEEVEQSKSAGYKPKSFDDFDDADELLDDDYISELLRRKEERDRRAGSLDTSVGEQILVECEGGPSADATPRHEPPAVRRRDAEPCRSAACESSADRREPNGTPARLDGQAESVQRGTGKRADPRSTESRNGDPQRGADALRELGG